MAIVVAATLVLLLDMLIGFDASCLAVKQKSGIDYMVQGLLKGLSESSEHHYLIYCYDRADIGLELPNNFTIIAISRPAVPAGGLIWYWQVAQDLKRRKADVFISTYTFSASLFTKSIQIVPDISPLTLPNQFGFKHRLIYRLTLGLAMRFAWRIATISQAVAEQLKQRYSYKKEITVFPMALDSWATSPVSSSHPLLDQGEGLGVRYFLSISTIQPRKNYANMIRAFAKFAESHPDFEYWISGKKGWYFEEIFQLVKDLKLEGKVKFLDHTPDAQMRDLLSNSAGLLYASFDEGFGIPPINAAYLGVPVLVSDIPVFHEILTGNEAIFVDPNSVESIFDGLNKIGDWRLKIAERNGEREERKIRPELAERFNWKKSANLLLTAVKPR